MLKFITGLVLGMAVMSTYVAIDRGPTLADRLTDQIQKYGEMQEQEFIKKCIHYMETL